MRIELGLKLDKNNFVITQNFDRSDTKTNKSNIFFKSKQIIKTEKKRLKIEKRVCSLAIQEAIL